MVSFRAYRVGFYVSVVVGVITAIAAISAGVSWGNGWMIRHEIEAELQPSVGEKPAGAIYDAISLAVERNNVELDERMDRNEAEQKRQGDMTEQIYEKVTGLSHPKRAEQ